MSKQKRILSFFAQESKREEHRPQMETCRSDNVDEDKLSDTDEREPFVEPKAKAARRNYSLSGWKNTSGCEPTKQRVCCVRFALSLAKQH